MSTAQQRRIDRYYGVLIDTLTAMEMAAVSKRRRQPRDGREPYIVRMRRAQRAAIRKGLTPSQRVYATPAASGAL